MEFWITMVRKLAGNKNYTTKNLPIDWKKQIGMAIWKRAEAQKLESILKPFVGHIFLLYGDGGWGSHIVRLNSVKSEPWAYYPKGSHTPVPTKKNEYRVGVSLSAVNKEEMRAGLSMFSQYSRKTHNTRPKRFTPWLGSWKLDKIVEA